ncbi:MAG: hypothetical protein JSS02_01985 [Planctomycetes bacterium]|nr:hypothetical protein [Planctomycetota bacterium]
MLNQAGTRCSDKRFLPLSLGDDLQLRVWTGRQLARGKTGRIPATIRPILQHLRLARQGGRDLLQHFGRQFFAVAGAPTTVDGATRRVNQNRDHVPSVTRQKDQDVISRTNSSVEPHLGVKV